MTLNWYPMDITVVLTDEAAFIERIRAMPWRNIRITGHYDIEAELLVANGVDARKTMTDAIERSFPDGGEGIYWVGQNRPWR